MGQEAIEAGLARGLGSGVTLRPRRPGLLQVDLPAYLRDGDEVAAFVRVVAPDRVVVTDLGHTLMRASYTQPLNAKMSDALERLARRCGFELVDGEVRATVPLDELAAAMFGLVQVESQAELALAPSGVRRSRSESFKKHVVESIRSALSDCDVNFSDPEVDPEGLYPVDLVVRGRRWVGVSIVSSDADANNAALSKLKHARSPIFERHRALWAVVPRDIEALTQISRRRIINEFLSLTSEWTEPAHGDVVGRLRDLAEPEQPLH